MTRWASQSLMTTAIAPYAAEGSNAALDERVSLRTSGGAVSAMKPIGPAAAVDNATKIAAIPSGPARVRSTRTPWATGRSRRRG